MIDRRVQKTLQALHEALISLILEKGYDATSVKDIIQRANVSRSTFYTHYVDKEHLLQGGLDNLGKFLLAQQRNASKTAHATQYLAFSHAIFEHAQGYKAVYRAMLGKHAGVVVAERMRNVLRRLVGDDLAKRHTHQRLLDVPLQALIEFNVGAIMSILTWWVDAEGNYSADELEVIFRRLAMPVFDFGDASTDIQPNK